MRAVLVLIGLLAGPTEIDLAVLYGEWAGANADDPLQNYAYFRLDDKHDGRLVYVSRGNKVIDVSFDKRAVSLESGYIAIVESFENYGIQAILSGWRSPEDRNLGLVTGVVYMYQVRDGAPRLFNTLSLRIWALGAPVPPGDGDRSILEQIRDEVRASENAS